MFTKQIKQNSKRLAKGELFRSIALLAVVGAGGFTVNKIGQLNEEVGYQKSLVETYQQTERRIRQESEELEQQLLVSEIKRMFPEASYLDIKINNEERYLTVDINDSTKTNSEIKKILNKLINTDSVNEDLSNPKFQRYIVKIKKLNKLPFPVPNIPTNNQR